MTVRRGALWAAAVVAALLLAGRALAGVYADYRWFAALDATSLWRARTLDTLVLRGGTGALAALFAFFNLYAVQRSIQSIILPRRVGGIDIGEELPKRTLLQMSALGAMAVGGLLALDGAHWTQLALARLGQPFREADPYFQADLGFFVYWLPLERTLYRWALTTFLVVSAVVVALYALTPSLRWERRHFVVTNYVRRHLVLLGCLLLVLVAWSARLDAFNVLLDGSGPGGAVVYVDHRARIPLDVWLAFLSFVAALVVFWFGISGQVRIAATAVLVVIVLSVGLRHLVPALVERAVAERDAAARERAYLETQASYTRRAYGVDRLLPAPAALSTTSLRAATPGISLWDPQVLERWYAHDPGPNGRRPALGWRATRGVLRALLVQRMQPAADEPRPRWEVDRVAAASVQVDGQPPATHSGAADSARQLVPEVLFGDAPAPYEVIGDATGAIRAPRLDTRAARLAYAWSLQDLALLARSTVPGATLVLRRDVRSRVAALAPFFTQGDVVVPAVVRDSLVWILDLYATSNAYPLSQRIRFGGRTVRYVQHAATAFVNAHTGRVQLAVEKQRDPITESWVRALPRLFVSWSQVDSALAAAVPPDVDGAHARALALARFGPGGGPTLDGSLPEGSADGASVDSAGEHLLSALAGSATLIWTTAVLDRAGRVAGAVISTSGPDRATYWQPLAAPGESWTAAMARLASSAPLDRALPSSSAPDASLVGAAQPGAVRAIPTTAGVALVQPYYITRGDDPPLLGSVRALVADTVYEGPSLGAALDTAQSGWRTRAGAVASDPFREAVRALYDSMRVALGRGDLAAFGRAYAALGTLLTTPAASPP